MISLKDIMYAINTLISNHLQMDVDSKNLDEVFERPSIRTSLDDVRTSAFMQSMKKREFTIRVYYFPREIKKNKIEILEITEKLERIFFDNIYIKDDFFIYIDDVFFETVDGVLVATMNFLTMEELPIPSEEQYIEYMEELSIEYKK